MSGFILIMALVIGFLLYIYNKNKPHNESDSIAIISGADGPTSLYVSDSVKKEIQEDKWNQLLQTCKEIIEPKSNKITGPEIKQFVIDKYDARETVLSARRKSFLKYNVILRNSFNKHF